MEDPQEWLQAKMFYQSAVASGEFVEGIYNCIECGHGGTCLVHRTAIKELPCEKCGSTNVTRTVVHFNS